MASNSHGGLIAGLIISILLIVMVVAALFYYRRRISHLKSELAHVQYIADPSSAPDRHHFDNPVYCYPTGANGPLAAVAGGSLNNTRIRNDLGGKNTLTNLERAKLGACALEEDTDGAYGGSVSSTAELYKNREADQCNPNLYNFNIYHTIDEEKVSKSVEHLYDEIKHKNREQVDEAYDKLDDSRPLAEIRSQYLRVASGSMGSLGGLGASSSSAAVSVSAADEVAGHGAASTSADILDTSTSSEESSSAALSAVDSAPHKV